VTAETMMLMPVLVFATAVLGLLFSLGLERIALESLAAVALREVAITGTFIGPAEITARQWQEGRLVCVELTKNGPIALSAKQCGMGLG
jgi:hypothetical protein